MAAYSAAAAAEQAAALASLFRRLTVVMDGTPAVTIAFISLQLGIEIMIGLFHALKYELKLIPPCRKNPIIIKIN